MTDYTHTDLQLVGRHVPDPGGGPFENMNQAAAAGHDVLNPVTGMYEIGVVIEGAFVPLIAEKASLVFDRIDNARAQQQADAAQQQAQTTPAPETGPQAGVAPTEQSSLDPNAPQTDQPEG